MKRNGRKEAAPRKAEGRRSEEGMYLKSTHYLLIGNLFIFNNKQISLCMMKKSIIIVKRRIQRTSTISCDSVFILLL